MRNVYFLLLIVLLNSCGTKQNSYNGLIVREFPQVFNLSDPTVIEEWSEYDIIYLVDTILIAQTNNNPSANLFIYNALNGENLGPLAYRGRGPKEFINLDMGQNYFKVEQDEMKVFVYDQATKKYTKINLTSRLKENDVKIEEVHKFPGNTEAMLRLSDTEFLLTVFNAEEKIKEYLFYNMETGETSLLDLINEENYRHKDAVKYMHIPYVISSDDSKTRLLINFGNQNRFKIANLDDQSEINVSVYDGPVSPQQIGDDMFMNTVYYNYFTISDKHIYGVYMNQLLDDILGSKPQPVEIHVYNMDGTPFACLKVQEHLRYITINEERGLIIGITCDGTICSYDIGSLYS